MKLSIAVREIRARALGGLAVLVLSGAAHAADYVADPGYNGGLFGHDAFAGGPDFRFGKKIVQADNGDVIVAGIVPDAVGGTHRRAIGLVRYNSAGVRQAWANPGANGHFSDQYVIYPCGTNRHCDDVKDLVLFGSRLYVLTDTKPSIPTLAGTLNSAAEVVVFGIDGSQKSQTMIDSERGHDPDHHVSGGGIALYDNMMFPTITSLVYAGTFIDDDGIHRPHFSRYTVGSDGTLGVEVDLAEPNPGNNCSTGMRCELTGIALGGRSGTSPPRIYLSGSRWHPGPPPGTIGWDAGWDYFVMNVNSSGAPGSNLYDGWVSTEGVGAESGGRGLAVKPGFLLTPDEIFVMVNVIQSCKDGIAVIKHEQDGSFAADFGANGRVRYGGSDETDTQACNLGWINTSIRADYPTDIAYADGKLGVVGLNIYRPGTLCIPGQPCPEDKVDGELAVIDAATGAIESWRGYAYSDTVGGGRTRHSGFWGVAATGNGTFTATGDVRYFDSAPAAEQGRQEYATLRLSPQGDGIFANGFDGS